MTQKEQQLIVQQALKYEKDRASLQTKYEQSRAAVYPEPEPQAPQRQVFKPYVVPDPTPKFNQNIILKTILAAVIGFFGAPILVTVIGGLSHSYLVSSILIIAGVISPVVVAYVLNKRKPAQIKEFQQTEIYKKYQQDCKEASAANNKQQIWIERQYIEAKENYDKNILPEYNRRKKAWQFDQNIKQMQYIGQISHISAELDKLYDTSKLIPYQYHNVNALQFIYNEMQSCNCNINDAIHAYNAARRLELEQERYESQMREEQATYDAINRQARHDRRVHIAEGLAGIYGLHQIHKTQTKIDDLKSEMNDMKKNK